MTKLIPINKSLIQLILLCGLLTINSCAPKNTASFQTYDNRHVTNTIIANQANQVSINTFDEPLEFHNAEATASSESIPIEIKRKSKIDSTNSKVVAKSSVTGFRTQTRRELKATVNPEQEPVKGNPKKKHISDYRFRFRHLFPFSGFRHHCFYPRHCFEYNRIEK